MVTPQISFSGKGHFLQLTAISDWDLEREILHHFWGWCCTYTIPTKLIITSNVQASRHGNWWNGSQPLDETVKSHQNRGKLNLFYLFWGYTTWNYSHKSHRTEIYTFTIFTLPYKNNINFILVWQFYLRFHPQISTFQTKQDWCPPFSSMIFPATETSMASSGILQPAMELTPGYGYNRMFPKWPTISHWCFPLMFPIDVSHWCFPLMFPLMFPIDVSPDLFHPLTVRRHLRAVLVHHQSHLPAEQGAPLQDKVQSF